MAKIRFYHNPLNRNEFKEIKSLTLKKALKEFDIDNKPLSVWINGKCPENVNQNKILMPWDKVDIYSPVFGSNNDWATIVTVVATAAALLTPVGWVAAAIAIGGALIAGALRANAPKPSFDKGATLSEQAVGLNASSPQVAQNVSRPLEVIPLVMGSIRIAPDLMTDPIFGRPLIMTGIRTNFIWRKYPEEDDYINHTVTTVKTSYVSRVVCYGMGDLDVSSRKFGSYPLDKDLFIWRDSSNDASWAWGDTFGFRRQSVLTNNYSLARDIPYHDDTWSEYLQPIMTVKASQMPSVQLTNTTTPDFYIPTDSYDLGSWSYFEGGAGEDEFTFSIVGQLYSTNTTTGAIGSNTTSIQLQYKLATDTEWIDPDPTYKNITNSGLTEIYTTFRINAVIDMAVNMQPNDSLCIRIRKAILDDTDNTSHKVARLSIVDVSFYNSTYMNNKYNTRFGQTVMGLYTEGFYITNNLSLDGQSNNYSAIVESKCYVYKDNKWVWEHSRNPAWWFLFFARGGFKNLSSSKDLGWPYSPTLYWQNYQGHSGNTELMFGCGYSHDKIDVDKIKEWAVFCDDNNLSIDMILRDDTNASETLERIANIGRGSVTYDLGKLSVIYEDKNQIPVTMFGMANIIAGSFNASYASKIEVSKVVSKFSNRDKDFQIDQIEVSVPFADQDNLIYKEVSLEGVTDIDQAMREARLLAARQFFQTRNYEWKTDHEGFIARRGDLVYLSHDSTQFGYSGRVVEFIIEGETVKGFTASSIISDSSSWVMVRLPNGEMKSYKCNVSDGVVYFEDTFLISDAPYITKNKRRDFENKKSRFANSVSDDFIFIADIKETTGKIVRISRVESHEDNTFTYVAIDEDPAMWAFELGINENPESSNDSIGVIYADNAQYINLKDGKTKISWDGSDDCLFMIIDNSTGLPVEINGRLSLSEKEATLILDKDKKYDFKILPLSITSKVESKSARIVVWQE